jgi:hypothetical protein
LFGYADAISLREARTVRSLLLVAATVLLVVAVRAGAGRHRLRGLAFAVAAAGFVVWFARVETVPPQIVFFTPHLVTLVVLAGAAGPSSRAPATWAPI